MTLTWSRSPGHYTKNEDQASNIFDAVVITQICCNSRENKKSMKRSDRFVFQKLIRNLLQMSWIFRVPDTMIQAQIVLALSHWCEGLLAAALQYRQFLQILLSAAGWACVVVWAGSVWSILNPDNTFNSSRAALDLRGFLSRYKKKNCVYILIVKWIVKKCSVCELG